MRTSRYLPLVFPAMTMAISIAWTLNDQKFRIQDCQTFPCRLCQTRFLCCMSYSIHHWAFGPVMYANENSHDVTFFHQRRSVGSPCQWRDVFAPKEVGWIPLSVTWRFAPKEVSWIPLSLMWRFCTKGGRLGPRVSDVTFFNHGGRLGPRNSDVTFFKVDGKKS